MKLLGVRFGTGNKKLGNIFTFSLPSQVTCPGASKWCKENCYARKYELIRPTCRNAYENNFELAQSPLIFKKRLIGVLPRILPCFRIHTSGDFFNIDYIKAWHDICIEFPQTSFWSYTRSWADKELLPYLDNLRTLPNVNLFASTDATMKLPPPEWRIAFVNCDERAQGYPCFSQNSKKSSCIDCGYCFRKNKGNVIFKVH